MATNIDYMVSNNWYIQWGRGKGLYEVYQMWNEGLN